MVSRRWDNPLGGPVLGTLLLLGLAPLGRLVMQAWGGSPDSGLASPFLDARTASLLLRSFWIAGVATLVAVGPGAAVGLVLARVPFRGRWALVVALFSVFCISPYVLALGWLGGRLDSSWSGMLLGSPWAVAWILGVSYLPLAALITLLGARGLPTSPEEAALLTVGPARTVWKVVLPGVAASCGVAALLVFDLCFADYAVASLLQVPTYPIEVFLYYAGVFQPAEAARACLPLLGVGFLVALALGFLIPQSLVRRWPASPRRDWMLAAKTRWMCVGTVLVGLACIATPPLLILAASLPSFQTASRALGGGMGAMGNSLSVSGAAAGLALLLAWPASSVLAGSSRSTLVAVSTLLLLPQCVPASAYGIAWVELAAQLGPAGNRIADQIGFLGPALCLAVCLAGPATLFLAGGRLALAEEAMEAARLQEARGLRRDIVIAAPQLASMALATAAILGALAMNAVGILVLTVPPGFEVLPLRTDNMLHYGLPEEAITLVLATAAVAAAPAVLLLLAAGVRHRTTRAC